MDNEVKTINFINGDPVIQTFWIGEFKENDKRTKEEIDELYREFRSFLDKNKSYLSYKELQLGFLQIEFDKDYHNIFNFVEYIVNIVDYIIKNNIPYYLDGAYVFEFQGNNGKGIINFNWKTKFMTIYYRHVKSLNSSLKETIHSYTNKSRKMI